MVEECQSSPCWGNDIVIAQGNGMVRTIVITKHLGTKVKRPKMLLHYDYHNGIIDEKGDIIFATKP
jgi:hypothetical protein